MGDDDDQILGRSRLRAHVTFSQKPAGPKFLTLADLVMIMHEESRDYRLLSVSLIQLTYSFRCLFSYFGRKTVISSLQ
jgi:hypothetical protein